MLRLFIFVALILELLGSEWARPARAQSIVSDLEQEIRPRAAQIVTKLIAWRRDSASRRRERLESSLSTSQS